MPTTYPLATLAATVSDTGISSPSYGDILASLQASAQAIYGADVYLGPDSQDGQLLAIFAQAVHDANQTAVAVYNSFSPATAQGAALSNQVRLNHITRLASTHSQVNVVIGGVAGTIIQDGSVSDSAGNKWDLPATVTIPPAGTITVTASAKEPGAIAAAPGTVTGIATPTLGWQTVTNTFSAAVGAPLESDASLRLRQQTSTALRSKTIADGLTGEILSLVGVNYCVVYDNDTNSTDANGIPAHTIAVVVEGGDATQVARTILNKKSQGCGTYGTTSVSLLNPLGDATTINFFVPTLVPIKVEVSISVNALYSSAIGEEIQRAVAAFVGNLTVGTDIEITRLYLPALLQGGEGSGTYTLALVRAAPVASAFGTANLAIAFNAKATLLASNVTILLV